MLDKETVIKTVEQYAQIVVKELNPSAVFLYGSYARGNARSESDIDVAVIFDGFKGDWLETSAQLWRLCRDISDDIEPVLLDSTNDRSGFVADVLKHGQAIFEKSKNIANSFSNNFY